MYRTMNEKLGRKYIFRWKSNGICVDTSLRETAQECWQYALEALRPANEPEHIGRKMVRKNGEVIEVIDE